MCKGKQMEHPLEHYIQPFTKCNMNVEDSFGLGLYIIHYILVKHDFTLEYKHTDGLNCFIIQFQGINILLI